MKCDIHFFKSWRGCEGKKKKKMNDAETGEEKKKSNSTAVRFELTRAEPNRFQVYRLNHSAMLPCNVDTIMNQTLPFYSSMFASQNYV